MKILHLLRRATYVAVLRPLYAEWKADIKALLNEDFNCRSTSLYSLPVVCVRNDQSLRLCVELNERIQVDRHPIPSIQAETTPNFVWPP